MSYVFWCTPCGKDHAGECPPKKSYPPGYVIELKTEGKLVIPAVGTFWKIQRRGATVNGAPTWMKPGEGGDPKTYEVSRVQGARVWIRVAAVSGGNYGSEYEYGLEPWTEEGVRGGWRLVPAQ